SALMAFAIQSAECARPGSESGSLRFTSLLVGTSSTGLSLENALGAILNAVIQANQALARLSGSDPVRIGAVQFVEVYLDLALQAARTLQKFGKQDGLQVDGQLKRLPGGRRRIYQSEPPGWWSRMQIKSGPQDTLVFSLLSNRARNEEIQLAVQRRNIDRLIDQAVHEPAWSQRAASPLYELLIPNRLRSYAPELGNRVLMLDPETARYPWELMVDRHSGSNRPLAVAAGMIRQLTTTTFRQLVIDVTNRQALVVGDPENLPPGFAPLAGARQEAHLVATRLQERGFEVRSEIGRSATEIMSSLFSDDYRVLHLAGHGVFEETVGAPQTENLQTVTGMVLGSGVYLTAAEIEQMGRVPELVFVNCCYLGMMTGQGAERPALAHHKFAASLSRSLIEMGVKAVIVAGWAVDDSAALDFAEHFYQAILAGEPFGEAVLQARRRVYDQHGERSNTWGAYQCYGDPFYRLAESAGAAAEQQESRLIDLEEAVVEVENFTRSASVAAAHKVSNLRQELEALYQELAQYHSAWLADPVLNAALGFAFGEVDRFKQAVVCFEAALKHKEASISVKAIEQLCNFRARWAVQVAQGGEVRRAQQLVTESLDQLRHLQQTVGSSAERLSLLAATYKRAAQIGRAEARRAALEGMAEYYRQARELEPENPYARLNQLTVQIVCYWMGVVKARPPVTQELQHLRARAEARREENSTDFWSAIGVCDCDLAIALLSGDLAASVPQLAGCYIQAWRQFGSARELRSVSEHLNFLGQVLERDRYKDPHNTERRARQRRALQAALADLEAQLQAAMEG
ncbi:MAG: CHAT domain-containing protein, partial [Anaerolineales bacterium]|nr:CHAT domain-containing protein [Anaerolineales bacterium]